MSPFKPARVLALLASLSVATAATQDSSFQPAPGTGSGPSAEAELATRLGAFVDGLAAAELFSGAVRLVQGDQVLLDRAWGEASKSFHVPNRTTTRFNLASTSKMFTAVLVAQLVEEGRLAYDAPLGRYLPAFPVAAMRERVTLEHLLTHTSGLGELMNERWERSSRTLWNTVDDWMALLADARLAFEPGTRYQYSNAGFLVLGAVVERVSGKPWDVLVHERVFEPAGMSGAGVFAKDDPREDVAVGYTRNRFGDRGGDGAHAGQWWSNLYTNPWRGGPAGGAYAATADLVCFFRALRAGTLLPAERVAELLRPRSAMGPEGPHYGYGFILDSRPGTESFGHAGDFWGVGAMARHYSTRDLTLVVLANYGDNAARRVAQQFEQLLSPSTTSAPPGFAISTTKELGDAERERLFHPPALTAAESERYARVARQLIEAVNHEDQAAYTALMAPGYLAGLDAEDPWKKAFGDQLGHFGRIQSAWAPRTGGLKAGGGALFAGHEGGVSIIVRFEEAASGSITFSLDEKDRVTKGSCWFKRGFSEDNVGPGEAPLYELE